LFLFSVVYLWSGLKLLFLEWLTTKIVKTEESVVLRGLLVQYFLSMELTADDVIQKFTGDFYAKEVNYNEVSFSSLIQV